MPLEHPVFVAQGGFKRLDEFRRLLRGQRIASEIVGPPDGRPNG